MNKLLGNFESNLIFYKFLLIETIKYDCSRHDFVSRESIEEIQLWLWYVNVNGACLGNSMKMQFLKIIGVTLISEIKLLYVIWRVKWTYSRTLLIKILKMKTDKNDQGQPDQWDKDVRREEGGGGENLS